jgi:hypothetical protein
VLWVGAFSFAGVKRQLKSPGDCGEESNGDEAKRVLLMGVNNLTIKRMN